MSNPIVPSQKTENDLIEESLAGSSNHQELIHRVTSCGSRSSVKGGHLDFVHHTVLKLWELAKDGDVAAAELLFKYHK